MSLQALLHPKSVAIVGASQNPQKVGGMPVRLLTELGYPGAVYPINAAAAEVQGLKAYASLSALPAAPELAIIVVPADAVDAALRQAVEKGVGAAIVLSSGFAEIGADGAAAQQRLADIARAGGLTLLGPNCLGVMNVREQLYATFTPAPLAGRAEPGAVVVGEVRHAGATVAAAFVHPNPLAPDRYLLVLTGAGPEALFYVDHLPELLPDYVVFDAASWGEKGGLVLDGRTVLAAGFFDRGWRLP